jgi:hypothetical protein
MKVQNILRFPAALHKARLATGLAQKAAALSLGLDQGQFCAVEKGRRPPFARTQIEELSAAWHLSPDLQDELEWSSAHDRYIRLAYRSTNSGDDILLLSQTLRTARQLDAGQKAGLLDYLKMTEQGASQVRSLCASMRERSTT